jgi:PIN domain-containing protein
VAGRFALFTDENVDGPLIKGLAARGWDVVRAVDVFGERTDDETLFAYAASHGRVFVTRDRPAEAIAIRWLAEGRTFPGMICYQTAV